MQKRCVKERLSSFTQRIQTSIAIVTKIRIYNRCTSQELPSTPNLTASICPQSQSRNQPDADFDPFGLDRFLSEAKRADKSGRKRDHHDRHDQHGKKRRD